jgi:asparagine synthase (glutamine-hydrolysing)
MCGIAATFQYDSRSPVDRENLVAMRDCMAARGPDASGLWTSDDGRVGLAHRRLSIIDLSERGAQPMTDTGSSAGVSVAEKARFRIVFNGEIYNYQALRERLETKGRSFFSDSDTEVLLHLYAEEGEAMVEDLRGMYAFALWDAEREGLFLARDPYGIKPLYLADTGSSFHAASQVRALRDADGVDTRTNPAGHVGFFLWGSVPEPHTLYRGIRALPAGHTLWVDSVGPREPKDFALVSNALRRADRETPPVTNGAGNGTGDPQTVLRDALLDTVEHHLVADVDVGLFLSAGLDSATLAALATEKTDRLRTLTLGFEEFRGTPKDEVPGAERLADRYGTQHETIWITQQDFADAHDNLFAAMDQPSIDGANSYFVSRAARQAGLKVALSGLGGDELFGGYPSFSEIPRLVSALGPIPGVSTLGRGLRAVAAPVVERVTSPKYAGLLEYGDSYAGAYLLRRGLYMPWELPEVLDPDLAREGWQALEPLARLKDTTDRIGDEHLSVTALESTHYMRNQLLRDTDWTSMAHSLEVRTPLVDWVLLRRLAPLIAEHGLTKQDMARTPKHVLPNDLINRPKSGFVVPVREWLLADRPEYDDTRGLRGWAQYVHSQFRKRDT